jgi:ribosome-associated protein
LTAIAQAIYDRKGMNIVALDVSGQSSLCRHFVIAEGNVNRHVVAIGHAVLDAMRALGEKPLRIEGETSGEWLVIDFGDTIVHVFMPGMRERYALEELWKDAQSLDLELDLDLAAETAPRSVWT